MKLCFTWIEMLVLVTGCHAPAILGGPSGPKNCPNGSDNDAGVCCPDGFSWTNYGHCEADPPEPSPEWSKRRRTDAGQ